MDAEGESSEMSRTRVNGIFDRKDFFKRMECERQFQKYFKCQGGCSADLLTFYQKETKRNKRVTILVFNLA